MAAETKEEVDVDLRTGVQEAFNEEQRCEHAGHTISILGTHSGPGRWYANIHCPKCDSRRVYVMCDPFKRHVQSGVYEFHCNMCSATMPAADLVVGFVPIGGGL